MYLKKYGDLAKLTNRHQTVSKGANLELDLVRPTLAFGPTLRRVGRRLTGLARESATVLDRTGHYLGPIGESFTQVMLVPIAQHDRDHSLPEIFPLARCT